MVVNNDNLYLGMLYLGDLVSLDPSSKVEEVMNSEHPPIPADMPARKVAREKVSSGDAFKPARVSPKLVRNFLGVQRYRFGKTEDENRIGVMTNTHARAVPIIILLFQI